MCVMPVALVLNQEPLATCQIGGKTPPTALALSLHSYPHKGNDGLRRCLSGQWHCSKEDRVRTVAIVVIV